MLEEDGILNEYDIVFLAPPALDYLTINALAAADIMLVPLGASFLEFDSTGRFFDMLHSTFSSIEEGENIAARALGRTLSPQRQGFTALIGQSGEQVAGIYEADYRDFNRDTYIRGRETFDATYAAFKKLLVGIWRRDELNVSRAKHEGDK